MTPLQMQSEGTIGISSEDAGEGDMVEENSGAKPNS